MYSRQYDGQELNFEASGGLVNSSLVMQDKQTDSYWSIMVGESTAGRFKGTRLVELPVNERVQWSEWRREHPDTLVLSVNGREWAQDAYGESGMRYWTDPNGFRGQQASDRRLATKAPIYVFELDGTKYAVAHETIEGGQVFELSDGRFLFLYRKPDAALFASTTAYVSKAGFGRERNEWVESGTGARFDTAESTFTGAELGTFTGFDTFWYNWSLNNPGTELLR